MLGVKVLLTGFVLLFLSFFFIGEGTEYPGYARGVPMILCFFGGVGAIVIGLLMVIWL